MEIFLFSLIPYLFLVLYKTKKSFHMLQQNYYDQSGRYLKWIRKNSKKVFFDVDIAFVLILLCLFFNSYVSMGLFFFLYLLLYKLYKMKVSIEQNKKPLVITARVKRMFITLTIIYGVMILGMTLLYSNEKLGIYYLILSVLLYLNYFVVWFVNMVNKPVEYMVFLRYKNMAMNKLKKMSVPVVGITGSYGKTSSKNIIDDILNVKMNTCASPKSFNTPYGLIRTINQNLDKFADIMIAEMGAFKIGEIQELCDLVHPKYGIITNIGEAHLESFGNRENIQKGKFELVESLPSDGIAILNKDDKYQVNYKLKNDCKIIWIGIDNESANICASNLKVSSTGVEFDCKIDGKNYKFKTKLLGKHNVYNVLAGIALGYELGLTIEELQRGVASVKPVEHRLELKRNGNLIYIDDAYNSNPVGANSALDVLNLMPGMKVIVTPGMIELGKNQKELNYEFGVHISKVCDYVILVGKQQTQDIYRGLIDSGYNNKKIYVINDVKEAFVKINTLATNETYILLENDLPDLFNEN